MNPNHDEAGKFASGSGGSSKKFTVRPLKGEKYTAHAKITKNDKGGFDTAIHHENGQVIHRGPEFKTEKEAENHIRKSMALLAINQLPANSADNHHGAKFAESGWIPIFKGGKQTDSAGQEHDGNALINKAVSTFNAKEHEPPAVIGHPRDNAPAWGWVQGLKREGDMLLAQFKDLVPEFKEMVNKGMFKKRSASFYADGRLRHVGFLGAMPPAVKGLPDVAFSETVGMVFEFADTDNDGDCDSYKWIAMGTMVINLRELLIEKFGKNTADQVVGRDLIDIINQELEPDQTPVGVETPEFQDNKESSMTGKADEVDQEARLAEFAEKSKADAAHIAELEAQLKKEKEERRKTDIASFVEGLKKDGKYLPAWDKLGMVEFMQKLDEAPIEFSEGKKRTPLEFIKGFLSGLPKIVDFKEISGGEELPEGNDKRDALIKNFMESNKVGYKQAVIEVAKKYPQLF